MKRLLYSSFCCAALLLVGGLAGCASDGEQTAPGQSAFSGVHVFEGLISEASGGAYVLVIGDESYSLEGNNDEIRKFAGQTVEVSASIEGNTLRVMRIGPLTRPSQGG